MLILFVDLRKSRREQEVFLEGEEVARRSLGETEKEKEEGNKSDDVKV